MLYYTFLYAYQWSHGYVVLVSYIVEVLQDPAVSARLSDTKAAAEVKALEDFYAMLQNDPNRAFYGFVNCYEFLHSPTVHFVLLTRVIFFLFSC